MSQKSEDVAPDLGGDERIDQDPTIGAEREDRPQERQGGDLEERPVAAPEPAAPAEVPDAAPPPDFTSFHFDLTVYQENITILGLQGEGKTTKAHEILDQIPDVPRWIWSPQRPIDLYGEYGDPCEDIAELKRGAYVYTGEFSLYNFERFCRRAMEFGNMMLVFDDIHEFCGKQKIPEQFARLINSGRNRGLASIFLSPSPNLVNNVILQSSQHIFCFRFTLESQIEWVRKNFFGPDAWILLPRHLRRQEPQIADFDVLPKHAFLYKKIGDLANQLVIPSA